jgi:glycosyltransferase involved in cell wall biosynthesis
MSALFPDLKKAVEKIMDGVYDELHALCEDADKERKKLFGDMKAKPTLSVIIPCHNNAYFRECLQSLAEQSDHDFTTIIVFDKCTDDSPQIADEFRDKLNIVTATTEGGKPSIPRNEGIRLCKTDYLTFLDSDDYYCDHEAVESIKLAAGAIFEQTGTSADAFRHGIEGDNGVTIRSFCFAWTLRKDFVVENNLFFDERLTFLEDMKYEIQIRFADPQFKHYPFGFLQLDSKLIHHRVNERSICHDVSRRLEREYLDYNYVFSDFLNRTLTEEQKDFLALVYMQNTFRILAERSVVRHIPYETLVKQKMSLIRQYTFGRLRRDWKFIYKGHPINLWSMLRLDCDINIVSVDKQNELMSKLKQMTLK